MTGDYRAGDVRHVVASPALATSDLGFTAAITPERGIPPSSRPLPCVRLSADHQPVNSRCWTTRATPPGPPARRAATVRAAARTRPAATARTAARSAPPRPCSSATRRPARTIATAAPTSHRTTRAASTPASRACRPRAASPGAHHRPGAEGQRGEVAPQPVRRRAVLRDPLPVAVVQGRQRVPPAEAVGAERRDHRRAQRAPPTAAAARSARDHEHGHRQQPRAAAARRRASPRSRGAAPATSDHGTLRRTAPAASAAMPQAATAANIASALTHCQIAAGPKTRNGAARRATTSAPSSAQRHHHGQRGRGGEQGDHDARRPAAAESDPVEHHEEAQRPRRVAGDVHRPVGVRRCRRADRRTGSGRPSRATPSERSTVRAVRRYSYSVSEDRADAVSAVDEGQAEQPRQPGGVRREQQLPPPQPLRQGRPPSQHREQRRRAAQARCPHRRGDPSRRAAAGSDRTCTSQPVTAGTTIAAAASSTPKTSPATGASRGGRPVSVGACVMRQG